jgi:hypothetical protein
MKDRLDSGGIAPLIHTKMEVSGHLYALGKGPPVLSPSIETLPFLSVLFCRGLLNTEMQQTGV